MKCLFMSFSTPELSFNEMLAMAKRFKYDGVEPRIDANHKHGVEVRSDATRRVEIKQHAIDMGIAISCVATSCTYADPKTAE
jgi:predicted xylose isomerase-like sugar epimerase